MPTPDETRQPPNITPDTMQILKGLVDRGDFPFVAEQLHRILVHGCSTRSPAPFKDGALAADVVRSRPLLACLDRLIECAQTTAAEKAALCKMEAVVEPLLVRTALGQHVNPYLAHAAEASFLVRLGSLIVGQAEGRDDPHAVRKRGQLYELAEQFHRAFEECWLAQRILDNALEVVVAGVRDGSYRGGGRRLGPVVHAGWDVHWALVALPVYFDLPADHRAVWERARQGAQHVEELRVQCTCSWPAGVDYFDAKAWMDGLVRLFTADAESREAPVPKWEEIYMFDDEHGKDFLLGWASWEADRKLSPRVPTLFHFYKRILSREDYERNFNCVL